MCMSLGAISFSFFFFLFLLIDQVVEHLRQVYSDIAAAKEAKDAGEETPTEPGEDEDEEVGDGHDPDDL